MAVTTSGDDPNLAHAACQHTDETPTDSDSSPQCLNGRAPPYLSEHCIPVSSADTRRHLRSANRHLLVVPRVSGSTLTAVGRSQLLARWPGTHSRILSGIQRAEQTVLDVYLKCTCSCVTSASSALGVLNDYALYKSTHALTHSLTHSV